MKLLSILSTFTLALLLTSNVVSAASHTYKDVPTTHNNYEDITYLLEHNIIEERTTYGINDIVTREEVAVMIAKALQLDGTPSATKFSDVPKSHPTSGYIQSAVEAGIIKGYDDGTFKPNGKITRGHMATFIARAFDLPSGAQTFKDVPKGHTAYEAVQQLAVAGITTGYEDGTFRPTQNLSRAHISAFLTRALIYHEANNFDVQTFLQTIYTNEDVKQQLALVNEQHEQANTLLDKENSALNALLAQKTAIEAMITATKDKLDPIQTKVEQYHTTISAANTEIQAYRASNKHLVYGTAKEKDQYVQTLEALQTKYAATQKEKEAALATRDQLNTQYNELKDSLNQLRAAIQTKQQAVTKQKETTKALKAAATSVNAKLVAIEQQKQREQAQKEWVQAQHELEKQQELAQKEWVQAQRELEKQQELAQREWAQQKQRDSELKNSDIEHSNPTNEAAPYRAEDYFLGRSTDDRYEEIATTPAQPEQPAILDVDQIEEEVVALVNEEREKEGLAPLQINRVLMAAARDKSQDMSTHNYYDHISPTYGDPYDHLKTLDINITGWWGENIAKGQRTAQQVMTAWMNSPGHRANILNADFTDMGVGFVQEGYLWTQLFIKK
ncbi:MAG: S-layer homology domain-containing protein [Solibacillus sp.]